MNKDNPERQVRLRFLGQSWGGREFGAGLRPGKRAWVSSRTARCVVPAERVRARAGREASSEDCVRSPVPDRVTETACRRRGGQVVDPLGFAGATFDAPAPPPCSSVFGSTGRPEAFLGAAGGVEGLLSAAEAVATGR